MTDFDTLETLIQTGGHRLLVNPSSSHFSTSNDQSLGQTLRVLIFSGTRHVLSEVGSVGTLRSLRSIQRESKGRMGGEATAWHQQIVEV